MDLAIIEIESDAPFTGLEPPTFAIELPKLRETVRVYGYPEGGSSMSVTEGIVSRIEYRNYSHGAMGLMVQVDAAINPGNSGGPAFVNDQVIGIAFQKRPTSDNIGYLIPSEEVLTFLDDVKDGRYDGKPVAPVLYQHLLNSGTARPVGPGGGIDWRLGSRTGSQLRRISHRSWRRDHAHWRAGHRQQRPGSIAGKPAGQLRVLRSPHGQRMA